MQYFDAHAHVHFKAFDEDREELLKQMEEAGVGALMVGTDYESSKRAIELVEGRKTLFASVGLHPNDNTEEAFDVAAYTKLASHIKVVAIGECGLDYYRQEETPEEKARQRELFLKHIEIAVAVDKPLVIHSRPTKGTQNAYRELIDILRAKKDEYGDRLRGDIHFFVGGIEEARELIELGFTISFTAVITFARDYDEVIRSVPLESILSETDAPYVAPEGRRGKRNDPLAAIDVVRKIAEVRGEEEEVVREMLLQNAKRVFGIL